MDIILNQVAIWRPCGSSKLNKRLMPAGSSYRCTDSPVYQVSNGNIARYCKDYAIGKGKSKVVFCLFVRTDINNDAIIEERLDNIARDVAIEQALKATANATIDNFEYLPILINSEDK